MNHTSVLTVNLQEDKKSYIINHKKRLEFFQSFFMICKKLVSNNIQLLNIFRNDIKRE